MPGDTLILAAPVRKRATFEALDSYCHPLQWTLYRVCDYELMRPLGPLPDASEFPEETHP